MAIVLSSLNGAGLNIYDSEQIIAQYVATSNCYVAFKIRLTVSGVGTGAVYTVWVRHLDTADTVLEYPYSVSLPKKNAADECWGMDVRGVFQIANTDKIDLMIRSTNANDTSVSWFVDWIDAMAISQNTDKTNYELSTTDRTTLTRIKAAARDTTTLNPDGTITLSDGTVWTRAADGSRTTTEP